MVQPKKPPLSIRIPAELLEQIDIAAAERKLTRHAMILKMLVHGFENYAPSGMKASPVAAPIANPPVRPARTVIAEFEYRTKERPRRFESMTMVQLGPVRPKYGDRLKGGKK